MPDRTEDMQETEALDRRVEELLTDVEETAARIDAALPSPPGFDQFETADSALGAEPAATATSEPAPVAAFRTLPSAPDAMLRDAADELEGAASRARVDEVLVDAAAALHAAGESAAEEAPGRDELGAAEFSSPDAIAKLDEKLAASATELSGSAAAGDVVDDRETEEMVATEERKPPAPPKPAASTEAAAVPAVAPAPAPVVPEAKPAAETNAVATPPRRRSAGMMLADAIRPLAVYTSKLTPGTRQTIAYAAVVTLFQAACLWAFLAFKGPPGEPMPTSDPVILRQPGDAPAAKGSHAEPKKTAAKASTKSDAHAGGGH